MSFGSPEGVRLSVQPLAGLRWTHVGGKLLGFGASVSDSDDWVDPFIGVRLPLRLSDRWSAEFEADIGGFGVGSSLSANGSLQIGYSMTVLNRPAQLSIGYRALYEQYHSGQNENRFALDAVTHGPLLGISLGF